MTRGVADLPFATYRVDQGTVTFDASSHFDPRLSILATARQAGYEIMVTITGQQSDPEVNASTNPPLPPAVTAAGTLKSAVIFYVCLMCPEKHVWATAKGL